MGLPGRNVGTVDTGLTSWMRRERLDERVVLLRQFEVVRRIEVASAAADE